MDFKVDNWLRNQKFLAGFRSEGFKQKTKLFKASIMAILFGIIIGFIVIFANGYNGFTYFGAVFKMAFNKNEMLHSRTMNYFAVYMLMGLGLALGFKVGIFNMGGSGQAVLGLGLATLALGDYAKSHNIEITEIPTSVGGSVFLLFILSGVMISTIAGLLKVFFNIHEVVTTVMLNWAAYFFVKWLTISNGYINSSGSETSQLTSSWLAIGDNIWILGIIIAVVSIAVMWFVLSFTTFGYKFNVVGKQQEAARYAGIKNKLYFVLTTSMQGLFIGMGAGIYYMQIMLKMNVSQDQVPSIGFDAIAVSLVAFNNLLGLVPVALLWAALKTGSVSAIAYPEFQGLTNEAAALVFGAIIYGAAIFALFLKIEPIKWIKEWIYESKDFVLKKQILINKEKIASIKLQKKSVDTYEAPKLAKEKMEAAKAELISVKATGDSEKIKFAKKEYMIANENYLFEKNNQLDILNGSIKTIKNENKILKEEGYKRYVTQGIKGIKNNYDTIVFAELYAIINELTAVAIARDKKIQLWKDEFEFKKEEMMQEFINQTEDDRKEVSEEEKKQLKTEMESKIKSMHEELNARIKELKTTINNASKLSVDKLNAFKEVKTNELKTNLENAKAYINTLDEEMKNKLSNLQKQEGIQIYEQDDFKIKMDYYEKQMEVAKKYGQYNISI